MKISEFRIRENYDQNLPQIMCSCRRLAQNLGWTAVSDEDGATTQWNENPFFSVYVTPEFCDKGRQFIRQLYARTPSRIRRGVQKAAVGVLSQKTIFRLSLKNAFRIPTCPDEDHAMWMPGNQRFRYFNFAQNTVCIFPKKGFSSQGIQREMEFRQTYAGTHSWLVPILRADTENDVFEEPLLDMHPINREASESRRRQGMAAACEALAELHQIKCRAIHPEAYLDYKHEQFEKNCSALKKKFAGLDFENVRKIWWRAAKIIENATNITVSVTHGDFQPGNVLIGYRPELAPAIALVDWEDIDMRASVYDEMTWIFNARSPHGLYRRIEDFLKNPDTGMFTLPCSPKLATALWSIEEWNWLCETSARPGIVNLPAGLCSHFKEISSLR